ncbi:MAG: CapA family protein [Chloroflexota bacterium]
MYTRRINGLFSLVLLLLIGIGCRQEPVPPPTSANVAATVTLATDPTRSPSTVPRTPTRPRSTATPTDVPTPGPTDTPTSPAPLRLGIPAQWEHAVRAVTQDLDTARPWQVVISENAEQLLMAGDLEAALVAGDGEFFAGSTPLALAVPFATDWDGVTLAQARDIQTNGHDLATVLPWDQLSAVQRALLVDGYHISDAGYPLQQPWSITARPEATEAARQLATRLQERTAIHDVKLVAVGDIMLDRALGQAIAAGDTLYPFTHVATILQNADLTVGNLESALGDVGQPANKSYAFRAPPQAAQSLAQAGFDVVSLANNHGMDYGPEALLQGISLLTDARIAPIGAGVDIDQAHEPYVTEVNGLKLGFLAYVNVPVEGSAPYFDTASWTARPGAPGLAWADPERIARDVGALQERVDHIIVVLHSGYEYVPSPSPEQVAAAYAAIDAGASLVIGHHAHILQGVEFRGEGVIVYGLGNFAFNITGPAQTAILSIWLGKQGVRQLSFVPAIIQGSGQPVPAAEPDASAIRSQIYTLSRALN